MTQPKSRKPPVTPAPAIERLKLELETHREELSTQNEDLRRSNALLISAKERYAQLYDSAPIAYFTISNAGLIVEANIASAALVDVSRQFLFGRSFDDLVVASTRASFRNFRERVLESSVRLVHENVLTTSRGLVPVRIEAGRLSGPAFSGDECILCVTDETERQAIAADNRRRDATAAESQRVASLGNLAGGVAHDFNNILAIVMAHADLILLDEALSADTLESARAIREAGSRAAVLSQQMLAYAGRNPVRPELLDLSSVVRSAKDGLTALVRHGKLRLELAEGLAPIRGDAAQLDQVVQNLVSNASEAIATGGNVIVRTLHCSDPESVLLEVADDGRGMDEITQKKAFDPFFSTKFAGRGLGLAVVHGNATTHGATVSVESRLQRGATFRVTFPVAGPRPRALAANDVADKAPPNEGLVLVVDDEEGIRAVAGRLLKVLGFSACTACDGIEALALIDAPPATIVAILLDLTMPRLDGTATLIRLRERSKVPVVLMSGYAQDVIAAETVALADGFLAKPFTVKSLERSILRALTVARNRQTVSLVEDDPPSP